MAGLTSVSLRKLIEAANNAHIAKDDIVSLVAGREQYTLVYYKTDTSDE